MKIKEKLREEINAKFEYELNKYGGLFIRVHSLNKNEKREIIDTLKKAIKKTLNAEY